MGAKSNKSTKNKSSNQTATSTAMQPKAFDRLIISVSIIGILLSTYALYVELVTEARPGYKAMCDISDHASCSKVLTSKYAKGFGLGTLDLPLLIDDNSMLVGVRDAILELPNCVLGVMFYCLMIFLTTFENRYVAVLQFILAVAALGTSIFLAYILAFILYDICVVCISTYVVNALLATFLYKKVRSRVEKVKNK